jgi:LysM repeat protein
MAERKPGNESRGGSMSTAARPKEYIVKKGDTLGSIAEKFGLALAALEKANPQMGPPQRDFNVIYPGDRVNIPAK